jgi:Adenylate and Guanylate cyclase catalytic domain
VIQFLREYYQAIGQVVTDLGGSILSFAGDGIISLVGAPLSLTDHAERAVRMALEIRTRFSKMQEHWHRLGLQLGLGVGVASGFVTVGTIASSDHLEYTAVGPTVNLAARLSSQASFLRARDRSTLRVVDRDLLEVTIGLTLTLIARPGLSSIATILWALSKPDRSLRLPIQTRAPLRSAVRLIVVPL